MSELAFNSAGEPYELPSNAVAWRPRRMNGKKGPPDTVYGRLGTPLILAIDATMEDLRQAVDTPGKYRLDALDEENKPIPNVPPAYVYVHADAATPAISASGSISMTQLLLEAMKSNRDAMQLNREAMEVVCEQSTRVVDRFTQVMEQTSIMIGAAHGIGLTTRPPRVVDAETGVADDADDDVEVEAEVETELEQVREPTPGGIDWNALARHVWPFVKPMLPVAMAYAGTKAPHLAPLLQALGIRPASAQKSSKPIEPTPAAATTATVEATADSASEAEDEDFQPTPEMLKHLLAIQAALQGDELAIVKGVIADMKSGERAKWIRQLSKVDVAAAVAEIRKHIGATSPGGAS